MKTDALYVLDTNVFIDAEQSESFADDAARFVATHSVRVSSVVVAELIIGTRSTAIRARVLENLRQQANILGDVTPTMDDWQTAAHAWTRLSPPPVQHRSVWNDLLLAASCARSGAILVTSNRGDFRRIARHIRVRHVSPWPIET